MSFYPLFSFLHLFFFIVCTFNGSFFLLYKMVIIDRHNVVTSAFLHRIASSELTLDSLLFREGEMRLLFDNCNINYYITTSTITYLLFFLFLAPCTSTKMHRLNKSDESSGFFPLMLTTSIYTGTMAYPRA